MRIENHPVLDFDRGKKVKFTFDGQGYEGYSNETVAAALLALKISTFRHSINEHRPRGMFCGIGRCASCNMIINGIPNTRSCVTILEDGMVVETQLDLGKVEKQDA